MDDGRDLLPQWRGQGPVRDALVVEYLDDVRMLCTATVITESWKCTTYLGGAYRAGTGELYAAGDEVTNLWDDASSQKAKQEHLELLERDVPALDSWRLPRRVAAV